MRQDVSNDLSSLRGLLGNYWKKNISNEVVLEKTCKSLGENIWECSFGKSKDLSGVSNYLIFKNIDFGRKIRPSKFNPDCADVIVKLGIRLIGDTSEDTDNISELGVNIVTSGSFLSGDATEEIEVISSWHLDKDVPIKEGEERMFTHSLYHLNFGGEAMTKTKDDGSQWNFGALFLMETPRLVHHPMDVILAVDFILKNFYHESRHKEITNKKPYKLLLRKASERFLAPYYSSIVSKYGITKPVSNMPPQYINPSLGY